MDGENKGKPYEQMDDLGGFPPIFGNTHIFGRCRIYPGGDWHPGRMSLCSEIKASLSKKNDGILNKGSPRVTPNLPPYDFPMIP